MIVHRKTQGKNQGVKGKKNLLLDIQKESLKESLYLDNNDQNGITEDCSSRLTAKFGNQESKMDLIKSKESHSRKWTEEKRKKDKNEEIWEESMKLFDINESSIKTLDLNSSSMTEISKIVDTIEEFENPDSS